MSKINKTRRHDGRDIRVFNEISLGDFTHTISLGAASQIKTRLNHRAYKKSLYPERTLHQNADTMFIWDVALRDDCPDEYRAVIEHFVPEWTSADVVNQGILFDGVDPSNPESALVGEFRENCYNIRTYYVKDEAGRTVAIITQNTFRPLEPHLVFALEYDDEKRVPQSMKCGYYAIDFYYGDDNKLVKIDEGAKEFEYGEDGVTAVNR
jgi:hypothetical protein